jgi:hypothetical protein
MTAVEASFSVRLSFVFKPITTNYCKPEAAPKSIRDSILDRGKTFIFSTKCTDGHGGPPSIQKILAAVSAGLIRPEYEAGYSPVYSRVKN